MMKFNEDEKTQFRKLTVRTANIGEDGKLYNLGSGTIIRSGNNYYVLTAGHCVDGMDEKDLSVIGTIRIYHFFMSFSSLFKFRK